MLPQSAVDRTGARVGLKFAFVGALCAYANSSAPFFPTMIDTLETAAADLESRHLDDAATICGAALKTIPDDCPALCQVARPNTRQEHGRAPDYLPRVQPPQLPHLHVETAVAHRGVRAHRAATSTTGQTFLNPSEQPSNACAPCFACRQLSQNPATHVRLKPNKDVDIGAEAAALTALEYASRHLGEIDSEGFSECKMLFLAHDCLALDVPAAEQSRKSRFWIGDAWKPIVTDRTLSKWRACNCERSMPH